MTPKYSGHYKVTLYSQKQQVQVEIEILYFKLAYNLAKINK